MPAMKARLYAAFAVAGCTAALVGAGPALAQEVRLPLAGVGSFTEARGLAVEQSTGDVYAIDGRNERQSIKVSATAGKFKLKFNGGERELKYNAKAEEVEEALDAMGCGGADCVSVGGGPGDATGSSPYEVQFGGSLASTDVPQIVCESGTQSLEGGSPSSGCTVTTTVNGVNGEIVRDDEHGNPANFSGLGTNVIDARKGPGGKACGEEAASCDVPTLPAGEGLVFSSQAKEAQVTVDESGGATAGDIYVTQAHSHLVDVFSPTGAYLGQLTEYFKKPATKEEPAGLSETCGVGVDGSGDVFLGDYGHGVQVYKPSANPVKNADNVADFTSTLQVCTLAFGAGPTSGFLFATRFAGELFKLNESTGVKEYEISKGDTTVTVDPKTGHVVAAAGSEVQEFDASGASSATLLHSQAAGGAVNGVSVSGSSGDLYLSRAEDPRVDVYGPVVKMPDFGSLAASEATGHAVKLSDTVSAGGGPAATCEFQYIDRVAYEAQKHAAEAVEHRSPLEVAKAAFEGAASAPCEPAGPFTGSATEAVDAEATGLAAETLYEVRLVGVNANGQIGSAPASFETLGTPVISKTSAVALSDSEAILTGAVNPRGLDSTTEVQYVTEAQFEADKKILGHDGFAEASTVAGPAVPKEVKGKGNLSFAAGTGKVTAGSKEVIVLNEAAGLFEAGQQIEGTGITANTTVEAVEAGKLILSEEALASGASVALRASSTTVTGLTVEAGRFAAGEAIEGTGVPANTTVVSVGEGELVLSKAPTEHLLGAALTATGPQPVQIALAGLAASTEYVARIVASNESGTAKGGATPFATFVLLPPVFGSCPNDALRIGAGEMLPDCRAYEQVTPVNKLGASAIGGPNFSEAAADGEAVVWGSYEGQPTTGGSSHAPAYVARRGAEGWNSDGALPATTPGRNATELGRDEELRSALATVPGTGEEGSLVTTDLESFARTPLLAVSFYKHVLTNPQFAEDTAHFVFEDTDALLPGAVGGRPNLYEYDRGALALAGIVPAFPASSCEGAGCEPAPGGSIAGSYEAIGAGNLAEGGEYSYRQGAISRDGRRVFFTEAGTGRLFVREDGERTVQVNAPQGGSDPNGHKPAQWLASTPDGSRVFFASCEKLTSTSTAHSTPQDECLTPAQGQDLYEYNTGTGELSDLTVDSEAGDTKGAQVQGLLGVSPDGAYVYFAANGVLAAGASAGNCDTSTGNVEAFQLSGECNLYLRHEGTTTFVARLGANRSSATYTDADNWAPTMPEGGLNEKTARVAEDGTLLFSSTLEVTDYDNTSTDAQSSCNEDIAIGPGPCAELYRYAPGDHEPTCVSCDPSGAAPLGNATLVSKPKVGSGALQTGLHLPVLTRNLSADGARVFFETPDRLVGSDINGVGGCPQLWTTLRSCQDVYEWEVAGSGSCSEASSAYSVKNGGCLYLISSGRSSEPSFFDDADTTGDNVFFFTYSPLVAQDGDTLSDLYDARVDGGIVAQQASPPALCGSAEGCRGAPGIAPVLPGAATFSFQGPGNLVQGAGGASPKPGPVVKRCAKGRVRRGGRCVAKRAKRHGKQKPRRKQKLRRKQTHGASGGRAGR
jgi:hypothetical protein